MDNLPVLIAVIATAVAAALVAVYVAIRRRIAEAVRALDAGDVARARALVAPLLGLFPTVSFVRDAAAEVLYSSGDPLSAASLWERALKRIGPRQIAPRLVAAYAALNRGGDARRVAALAPDESRTRLALGWSELVALGGDRASGRDLAAAIERDLPNQSPTERAMGYLIVAIASATDAARSDAALASAAPLVASAHPVDRAFLEYLEGVARRERGERDLAIATFDRAMATLPDSIGSALARRELSHLLPG